MIGKRFYFNPKKQSISEVYLEHLLTTFVTLRIGVFVFNNLLSKLVTFCKSLGTINLCTIFSYKILQLVTCEFSQTKRTLKNTATLSRIKQQTKTQKAESLINFFYHKRPTTTVNWCKKNKKNYSTLVLSFFLFTAT